VSPIVEQVIELKTEVDKPFVVWMQLGILMNRQWAQRLLGLLGGLVLGTFIFWAIECSGYR
jgi:hypothetical protein